VRSNLVSRPRGPDALVSVVVAVYNREATVERAIRSALHQTHQNLEVLVVDDASTDGTPRIVGEIADPRVHLIRHVENLNASAARNTGAAAAAGSYVAFLDSDDEWLPGHLARRLDIMESKDVDGVFGSFYLGRHGSLFQRTCAPYLGAEPLLEYVLSGRGDARTSTFFFRTDAVREIGFDAKMRKHQDWDLAGRMSIRFRLTCDPEATVILHESEADRMTDRLDHAATAEFVDRHAGQLSSAVLARFYTLWAMRTLRMEGRSVAFGRYLELAQDHAASADRRIRAAVWCLARRRLAPALLRTHDWYVRWKLGAGGASLKPLQGQSGASAL
jgi:GT2 family glycosyltransferase